MEFLREMETSDQYEIVPVIPSSWKDMGYEARLMETKACSHILHRSCEKPADLETAITVMPVVPRDVLVKTALCISDTYETSWISECMDKGSRVVLLRSGLARFSGKEKPAYRNRVMNYYRQILEYGVEICSVDEFTGRAPYESPVILRPERRHREMIRSILIQRKKGYIIVQCGTVCIRRCYIPSARRYCNGPG